MTITLRPWQARVLKANVVAQTGIVITGAIVRLTASGLGCPTWPECVEGSIAPTSTQTEAWHKWVEFGNRLLTFVLVIVALATILAVRSYNKQRTNSGLAKRPILTKLALICFGGIFAQAILGGITVLTGLHPLTVAAHFLVSIALIAVAYHLYWRALQPNDTFTLRIAPLLHRGLRLQTALALVVLVIGTLVTGSGPHAGDSADITRLPFDPRIISWIHADVVLLFFGLTLGLIIGLYSTNAPRDVTRNSINVLIIGVAQGLIGYIQYFTALPWVLVAFHVLGACLLWIATLRLLFSAQQAQILHD